MKRSLILFLLLLCGVAHAQQLAYIYIQGDKQLPFYVKLEGNMQERYGKNYCILSQMAPGPTHLEILFQQHAYPAQQFTIQVPEGGSRGFLLVRKNEVFSLYDLQQHFYLPAGNREEDDHLPPPGTSGIDTTSVAAADEPPAPAIREKPAAKTAAPKQQKTKTAKSWLPQRKKAAPAATAVTAKTPDNDPQFLQNIELNNGGGHSNSKEPELVNDSAMAPPVASLDKTFRNSDCPQAMDNAVFEQLYKQMIAKSSDEDRIAFLNGQMDKCYLSWQARTLGTMLSEDAARYTFLKRVYPRIVDQQEFPLLDDMLRSEVWKTQFNQLVHP